MYYLVAGDMSTFYGQDDREEMIVYRHFSTTPHETLENARERAHDLIRRRAIDSWVIIGEGDGTWQGLVFNDTGHGLTISQYMELKPRQGWDARDKVLIPWESTESV